MPESKQDNTGKSRISDFNKKFEQNSVDKPTITKPMKSESLPQKKKK